MYYKKESVSWELEAHKTFHLLCLSVASFVTLCFFSEVSSVAPVFSTVSMAAWGLSGDLDFIDFSGVPPACFSFKLVFLLSDLDSLREREDFREGLSLDLSGVISTAGDVWVGVVDLFNVLEELSLWSEPEPASLCKLETHYKYVLTNCSQNMSKGKAKFIAKSLPLVFSGTMSTWIMKRCTCIL